LEVRRTGSLGLRRSAVSIAKLKSGRSVTAKVRELQRNTRMVFDYSKMTKNTRVPLPCSKPGRSNSPWRFRVDE
jgi:hypothetical protein